MRLRPAGLVTNAGWRIPLEGLPLRPFAILLLWDALALLLVWRLWKRGLARYASAN